MTHSPPCLLSQSKGQLIAMGTVQTHRTPKVWCTTRPRQQQPLTVAVEQTGISIIQTSYLQGNFPPNLMLITSNFADTLTKIAGNKHDPMETERQKIPCQPLDLKTHQRQFLSSSGHVKPSKIVIFQIWKIRIPEEMIIWNSKQQK